MIQTLDRISSKKNTVFPFNVLTRSLFQDLSCEDK